MDDPSRSKIALRQNSDGTVTRVVKKIIKKKVTVKKPQSKEKNKHQTAAEKNKHPASDKTPISKSHPPSKDSPSPKRRKIVVARRKKVAPHNEPDMSFLSLKTKASTDFLDKNQLQERENFNKLENQLKGKKGDGEEFSNIPSEIEIPEAVTIKDLAHKLNLKASQLIKKFLSLGVMNLTVNDSIDADSATILCAELGCNTKIVSLLDQTKMEIDIGDPKDDEPRPPIVTVMGHVDHGKTSLLDAMRKTNVVASEAGGITQHIGAYRIEREKGAILFIDTPGHAAFSAMRARGAKVTDVAVLVVSAVDGVMPQTLEAISHIKEADIPVIVAINKCDLKEADAKRIKTQLSEHGLISEEWGGAVVFVEVSALKGQGINELFDALLLQAEMSELKANPYVKAHGYVIESKIEQGRGNVASVVVKNGILKKEDFYLSSHSTGKVRAMFDEHGKEKKSTGPSTVVEIIGISDLPQAGELFQVVENEKEGRRIAERRAHLRKETDAKNVKKVNIENLFDTLAAKKVKELKALIKGDVYGSVEAIKDMLTKQKNDEVKVSVIHAATGGITENDVNLASASDALIIGFKVRPNSKAKKLAEREKVDIRLYQIIYDIIEDIQKRLQGMLTTETLQEKIGTLEIKEIFKISKVGKIAGCAVTDGKVAANSFLRLYRDDVMIHEGKLAALKRFKDDAKEVVAGQECGLQIENYYDIKVGDTIECISVKEIQRKLDIASNV